MADFWLKVGKTLNFHGRQVVRGLRGLRWRIRPPEVTKPVIIVGCSRAGTTLVYKTFSESVELGSLQRETHDFWAGLHSPAERNWESHIIPESCANRREREQISRYFYIHTGRCRFVDKNNQNGLCIPYLYRLFPEAHFVYVKRSPGDNIHSLIEGWSKADEFATWADALPARVNISEGRYRRWCFFLPPGWRDYVDDAIENVCAFQYRAINMAILDARALIPARQWSEVFYEDLVQDPVSGFGALFTEAGLTFDDRLRSYCQDVLSMPFNAFSEIRLDKWKDSHNAQRVANVLPQVVQVAEQMGYTGNRGAG